jgi:hypothetical protein
VGLYFGTICARGVPSVLPIERHNGTLRQALAWGKGTGELGAEQRSLSTTIAQTVTTISNVVLPLNGFANTLFRETWIQVSVLGHPAGGYRVTLIGLLVLGVLAFAVNGIVERMTGHKFGSTFASLVLVILGALLVGAFVLLPFDFAIEGVRIIASLLGALVVAVFVVLVRHPKGGGSSSH